MPEVCTAQVSFGQNVLLSIPLQYFSVFCVFCVCCVPTLLKLDTLNARLDFAARVPPLPQPITMPHTVQYGPVLSKYLSWCNTMGPSESLVQTTGLVSGRSSSSQPTFANIWMPTIGDRSFTSCTRQPWMCVPVPESQPPARPWNLACLLYTLHHSHSHTLFPLPLPLPPFLFSTTVTITTPRS